MAAFASFLRFFPLLAVALVALNTPIHAQINSACSPTMLTSFAPCMNFVTNNSAAGAPPTPACCSSLQSITSNGTDCMCLIASGSPFQVPINRTLAISLPRACNMPGVPLQCKAAGSPLAAPAAGSPLAAPGPAAFSPSLSPEAPAPLSPEASTDLPKSESPGLAPEAETTPDITPPSTTSSSQAPTANSGSRPVVTPSSAAGPPASVSPSLFFTLFGAIVLKNFY